MIHVLYFRKHDYENFLCTLLLPHGTRTAAFAIRAFNVEVAQVEDQVHDLNIGTMRLKFWKDSLKNMYNNSPPKSPVTLELHRVLQKHKLSKRYFDRLIDARMEKLSNPVFPDLSSIERYAENTVSSIYYLLLEAQGVIDVNADHIASHLGKAHGVVTLIRSIPYNAHKRVMILPQNILMKNNVSFEAIFQREITTGFKDTIFEISSCAKQHLDKATSLSQKVEKKLRLIFLPMKCLENYLEELRRLDFNVFDTKLQKRNNLLPLQLYWRKLMS